MKQKLLLLLATFSFLSTQAQITLVNPEPDFQITLACPPCMVSNFFQIDLDGDGTPEFRFRYDFDTGDSPNLHIESTFDFFNGIETSVVNVPDTGLVQALSQGVLINSSTPTSFTSEFIATELEGSNAEFLNTGDQYIGFKAEIGSTIYYGWILVNLTGNVFTIKQYAFTTNPNGILTGQGGALSVSQKELETVKLYPNPVVDVLNISLFQSDFNPTYFQVLDLSGRIVHQDKFDISNGINCNSLSSGQYILQLVEQNSNVKRVQSFIKD
ncbi:hypothetical protein CHU92_11200 [Flavobacterium cyanobacteriorum]|uniref:Secretion system C-terminal sorting domain-containing protein n=1 Tax=Flavobacterium cyanobacteriorum TaxID=2022802 RepID=A0A255Z0P9_9FLAO|nr:T9SS type A sorting domain-containing protein [Flavobacterium cyanobacteriorum]OYQ35073.1 hypothetical protein CHU92_11200 [Flavobacterium cyanobacteriorum]